MEYTVNLGKESLKKIANAIGGVEVEELNVTQNGVYTAPEGKAYSPVKVNVAGEGGGGESDFSTAVLTIVNNTGSTLNMDIPCLVTAGNFNFVSNRLAAKNGTTEKLIPIYKDFCVYDTQLYPEVTPKPDAVSGNVEEDEGVFYITGDCTFTFGTK